MVTPGRPGADVGGAGGVGGVGGSPTSTWGTVTGPGTGLGDDPAAPELAPGARAPVRGVTPVRV